MPRRDRLKPGEAGPKWSVGGWRVMVELIAGDGTVCTHEIGSGGSNTTECSAATVGLTLTDGKRILAALQHDLVRAQAEEYCRQRRVCSHCRSQRPLKDVRARRLSSCLARWRFARRGICPAGVR
jgi:hypothetical protein